MFQQFTLTDKDYWMSFFFKKYILAPLAAVFVGNAYSSLICNVVPTNLPPVTQNFASQEPLRDQSVELWQIFHSRIKLRPSEDLMTNHVSLLKHLPQ